MLICMRSIVTSSAILPGILFAGMRKATQEATTRIPLGKYTLVTCGAITRSKVTSKPDTEKSIASKVTLTVSYWGRGNSSIY